MSCEFERSLDRSSVCWESVRCEGFGVEKMPLNMLERLRLPEALKFILDSEGDYGLDDVLRCGIGDISA